MRNAVTLTAVLLILSAFLPQYDLHAQDDGADAIATELTARREEHREAREEAKASLTLAFENARKKIESNTFISVELQLTQLDDLEAKLAAFVEQESLPTSIEMKPAVDAFRNAIRDADQALLLALDIAIKGYRDARNFEAIKEILQEQKERKASTPGKKGSTKLDSRKGGDESPMLGRDKLTKALAGKRITWDRPHTITLAPDGSGAYTKTGAKVIWAPLDERRLILLWVDSNDCDMLIFSPDKKTYDKRWLGKAASRLDSIGEVLSK